MSATLTGSSKDKLIELIPAAAFYAFISLTTQETNLVMLTLFSSSQGRYFIPFSGERINLLSLQVHKLLRVVCEQ